MSSRSSNKSSNNNKNNDQSHNEFQYLLCYFIISVAVKVLLFPAYRSTDFDVHRHWKALTRSLDDISEWYFDNEHVVGGTVHTLDYPPSFALFEYFWSSNVLTNWLVQHEYLDVDCLALESSSSSPSLSSNMLYGYQNPSMACVAFMRSTVIISDLVLWFGAWMIASAVTAATTAAITSTTTTMNDDDDDKNQKWRLQERQSNSNTKKNKKWTIFGLIVTNPGLLWLDSIHFQYNGFLLGILLLSLSCLVRGNHHHASNSRIWFHVWHILGGQLFAFLLTLKHLYMTLSLWYFAYLFRRYCFGHQRTTTTTTTTQTASRIRTTGVNNVVFKPMRLLILGVVTVTTLVVPFLPFLQSSSSSSNNHHRTAMDQARRIFERLFPFGRGLVHDYWAGNVWAIYMAMTKIFPALKASEPSPNRVIGLLFGALLPGAVVAWKAAAIASKADADVASTASSIQSSKAQQQQQQLVKARIVASDLLWSSFTYTTTAAFMMAYHVHEKAILTTLVPMTIWLCCSLDAVGGYNHHQDVASENDNNQLSPPVHASSSSAAAGGLLLWRTMAFGLLGLFPLLFHPTELLLKVFSFTAYLVVLDQKMNIIRRPVRSSSFQSSPRLQKRPGHRLLYTFFTTRCFQLVLVWFFIAVVILILECIPLRYFGRYEFVPLALTSLTTALGLLISFLEVSWRMMQQASSSKV